MLENINLARKLSRDEFKSALPALQERLYDLEKACWDQNVPTIIAFEGWDASGKGTAIGALTQRLDPRGFKLYPITAPRTYEQHRPWLWRFWLKVPNRGEMIIFDHSWYGRVLEERVEGIVPEKVVAPGVPRHRRIRAHAGRRRHHHPEVLLPHQQEGTEKKIRGHRSGSPGSVACDRCRLGPPQEIRRVSRCQRGDVGTDRTEFAPWTIVEATSKWYARKKLFETIIAAMEKRLGANAPPRTESGDGDIEGC